MVLFCSMYTSLFTHSHLFHSFLIGPTSLSLIGPHFSLGCVEEIRVCVTLMIMIMIHSTHPSLYLATPMFILLFFCFTFYSSPTISFALLHQHLFILVSRLFGFILFIILPLISLPISLPISHLSFKLLLYIHFTIDPLFFLIIFCYFNSSPILIAQHFLKKSYTDVISAFFS